VPTFLFYSIFSISAFECTSRSPTGTSGSALGKILSSIPKASIQSYNSTQV